MKTEPEREKMEVFQETGQLKYQTLPGTVGNQAVSKLLSLDRKCFILLNHANSSQGCKTPIRLQVELVKATVSYQNRK